MRYLALCTDYDGTLATDGQLLPDTVAALERLLASGRRLVLVTGRELDDLQKVCPRLDLFEYVVAENGALLFKPSTGEETPLGPRPPDTFVALLRERGVGPISVGRVIVATWEPHESTVLATIRDLGLELQVIFNKGAVMILPTGVNKATGLTSALEKMGLSPHNAVGVGDAENDHALLALCECSAAVSNALPTLKEAADIVTKADHGAGVVELIDEMLRDDLASREPKLTRHHVLLGTNEQGEDVRIPPYGQTVLIVGEKGVGRSVLATRLLDRLATQGYSFGVIDVEGDYGKIGTVVSIGDRSGHPHWMAIDGARPTLVTQAVAQATTLFIALGRKAQTLLDEFCQVRGIGRPESSVTTLREDEALAWWPAQVDAQPFRLNIAVPQQDQGAGGGESGVGKPGSERAARGRTRSLH